ncbi:DUF883 family protein [Yoonia sp. 208BN28-4]|uniref:DUF883 family protein n=1 Tax=Yoonia sp. 208BN28-4 TaxID=3126505 RepID=UPI003095E0BE
MSSSTQNVNGKTNAPNSDDLAEQIKILRDDLGSLTQTIADMGRATGENAVNAAKSKVNDVRDAAMDRAETAQLHAMEVKNQADDFIRTQPATALGVAAGLGFLVGFMSSRR